jgi:hypothetical protein
VLEGVPYLYSRHDREMIRGEIDRRVKGPLREVPSDDETAVFKRIGMLFHHLWLDHVVLRPPPTIVTAEGDAIALTKAVFDTSSDVDVVATLLRHRVVELIKDLENAMPTTGFAGGPWWISGGCGPNCGSSGRPGGRGTQTPRTSLVGRSMDGLCGVTRRQASV